MQNIDTKCNSSIIHILFSDSFTLPCLIRKSNNNFWKVGINFLDETITVCR